MQLVTTFPTKAVSSINIIYKLLIIINYYICFLFIWLKYTFYVKITTSKDKTLNVEDFDATILDKDGNKIETLSGYIGDIDNKSKKEITIICNEDLSKAYEIVYTVRINND